MSPVEGDNFKDSVIIEINGCTKIGAELLAKVVEPVIEVTDIAFGVLPADVSNTRQLTVTNTGKVDLVLSGVSGPKTTEFTLSGNGWNITPTTTLTLPPGGSQELDVSFISKVVGTYVDTVFFTSNATKVKNYSVLTAATIQGDLGVVGYNWPKLRTNKTYGDGTITLKNFGTGPITIVDSKKVGADASAFFVPAFGNQTLEADQTIIIRDLTFTPNRTGQFEAQVQFITTESDTVTAMLTGMGKEPLITMEAVKNFGETPVGGTTPNNRTVFITNDKYEWDDTVTITDFTAFPAGSISWIDGVYSPTEGFSFDKAAFLGSGLVLAPGDTAFINANFIAQKENASLAEIRPVSDAKNNSEVKSVWTGFGKTQGITAKSTTDLMCINADGTITVTIENSNNTDAVVESITATSQSPNNATFEVLTPMPLTVSSGTTGQVTLRVSSPVEGTNTATLLIKTSVSETSLPVAFSTKDYTRTSSIARDITAEVGETKQVAIKLDNGENFTLADVSRLDITLKYEPLLVQVEPNSIATAVAGFTITDRVLDAKAGTIAFSLVPTATAVLPKSGELTLATMDFSAFLNERPVDETELTQTVTVVGNECLKIESTPGKFSVNPVCGGDVRRIAIGTREYSLQNVSPNPVRGAQTDIEFSVGLKTYTTIEITNAMGVVVATLVNQVLEPDTYAVTLNTQDMSSGMYFYRIVSGPYTDVKKLIISK